MNNANGPAKDDCHMIDSSLVNIRAMTIGITKRIRQVLHTISGNYRYALLKINDNVCHYVKEDGNYAAKDLIGPPAIAAIAVGGQVILRPCQ